MQVMQMSSVLSNFSTPLLSTRLETAAPARAPHTPPPAIHIRLDSSSGGIEEVATALIMLDS